MSQPLGVIVDCTDFAVKAIRIWSVTSCCLAWGCSNYVLGLETYIEEESAEGMWLGMTEDGEIVPDEVQEETSDDSDGELDSSSNQQSCEDAVVHLADCGWDVSAPEECDQQSADEARLLLALECEELDSALVSEGPLPLCRWFGWNCDDAYLCGGQVPADDYRNLLLFSDVDGIARLDDVVESYDQVASILSKHSDGRGLYSAAMKAQFQNAASAVSAGSMVYPDWTGDYLVELGSIYLSELRHSLVHQETGGYWYRYFDLVEDCTASPLRVAIVGLTTHLMADVPEAVRDSGGSDVQETDFLRLGDVVAASSDKFVEGLFESYGVDGQAFFDGMFQDKWDGGFGGAETSSVFAFETIEGKSWKNGLWLQNSWVAWAAQSEIWSSWNTMDGILATLDQSGSI